MGRWKKQTRRTVADRAGPDSQTIEKWKDTLRQLGPRYGTLTDAQTRQVRKAISGLRWAGIEIGDLTPRNWVPPRLTREGYLEMEKIVHGGEGRRSQMASITITTAPENRFLTTTMVRTAGLKTRA